MIRESQNAAASVVTPPADTKTLFLDTDNEFKTKDESGTVATLRGDPGQGVPTGGTAGQFLRKQSGTNYDTAFAAVAQSEVTNLTTDLAAKAPLDSPTFTGTPTVPDDSYDATGWNGSTGIPTKNAIRDKIEAISSAGIPATIVDAKGDIIAATAADTVARLAVGSDGQRIKADSAQSTGLAWVDEFVTVPFVIDGGGAVIATGLKGGVQVDVAGTIVAVTTLALDTLTGSIVVDIWKDTYANHPPTVADTITASAKPTITTATKATDSTLTGWTTAIAAGDILFFNVDSVTTLQRVLVSLKIKKS